ncbi:SMI1/KNR4 family protein SUKH-1 [Streptomyces sp. 846.5]|nr:SMI1/KNR4 family protein [Streptomyces sp. 846.5]TDU05546.1 SMI1/KNR4 family protein SUKH-1 [Streptomyces sp. 846.5]
MNDHSALLLRVRTRAAQKPAQLPARLSSQTVAEAESELGFALPPLLTCLYCEVANGGFGPGYKLLPLVGDDRTAVATYRAERAQSRAEPPPHWPHGILPIMDWGCGMYAAVDCLRPDTPVLLFEPNAVDDNWADAWFQDAASLSQWLTSWLGGTGWWEEDVMLAEDAADPQPWPDAAERIVAMG